MNPERGLSAKQEAAIELLCAGESITDAARKIGVARCTLSEWANHTDIFQRVLEMRRGEAFHGNIARLRRLATRALDVLERALGGQEISSSEINAAVSVLRLCGFNKVRIPLDGFDLSDLDRGRSMRTAFDSIGEMLRREKESEISGDEAQG